MCKKHLSLLFFTNIFLGTAGHADVNSQLQRLPPHPPTNSLPSCLDLSSPSLPEGSYKSTCVDCVFSGDTLSAYCRMPNYFVNKTSININSDNCEERIDIKNSDGKLECVPKLPTGSWQKSCGGAQIDYHTHTFLAWCSPTKKDNSYCVGDKPDHKICKKSSVDFTKCGRFSYHNHKGNLTCD